MRVKPHNSPPFKILYKETTMNKKFIFAALATSFLLTACSSDDGFNGSQTTSPLSFKVENEVVTRTTTENEGSVYKTKFVVGESIGIYGYEANNKKYSFTTTTELSSEYPISILSSQEYTFHAYSPYVETSDATVSFSVKEDQSKAEDFNASNFLVGIGMHTGNSSAQVNLTFSPKMAMVCVNMSGASASNITDVSITNVHKSIKWNAATAEPELVSTEPVTSVKMYRPKTDEPIFLAFVPVQTINAGTSFLSFTIGSKKYTYTPAAAITLKAGSCNSFTISSF